MSKIKNVAIVWALIFVPGAIPVSLAYIAYKKFLAKTKKI